MTNREWFKLAKFGMMVHFGLYSVLGGEWKGQRSDFHGEWIQTYYRIPNAEYEQIAKAFNPIYFNAEEWVKIAQDAGMQYMVVTSKHHDGFALFDSKYDDYNCVKGSPFGRDLIAELAEACQKHGMKLGLYYSQDQDWHEKDGGGYRIPWVPKRSWTNDWDFP
ncbi:MAG: alpha-L-fucosidase, partial [Clostridia bacterium]|nr:alpha-L-fucosidase [Clostridia bacterium]